MAQFYTLREAAEILRQVARENPGTTAAFDAEKQLRAESARRERNLAVENIFELARGQNHRAVVTAIDELEKKGELEWVLQLQRLYSLQSLGEHSAALAGANALAATHPRATDLALLRAELLARNERQDEAIQLLQQVRQEFPGTPAPGTFPSSVRR